MPTRLPRHVSLRSPPAAGPLTPSVCQTRQQPWFPPIVLFEDTNPLRHSKCKAIFPGVVARVIPGCQLQTWNLQQQADGWLAMRAYNGFRTLVQHAPFSQIQDGYCNFNSTARGCVGTALSAADNAELHRAAVVAVFPPPGAWYPESDPVFA